MARVCIPLLLLATFILGCLAAAKEELDCRSLLNEFNDHFNRQQLQSSYNAQDLLFVLRTPETHAEQLESCLIRPGVVGTKRCPSFNAEQIDNNIAKRLKGCNVLSSVDDLSVIDSLDANVAVAAQLRDPVERVVSAYEVAVEVAAQKLEAAAAKNPFEAMHKQHHYEKVFPWSKLGAFLAKDMQKRVSCVILNQLPARHSTQQQPVQGLGCVHPANMSLARPFGASMYRQSVKQTC